MHYVVAAILVLALLHVCGVIDGEPPRDSVDVMREERRTAEQEANQRSLIELCAAMRDAGAQDACR